MLDDELTLKKVVQEVLNEHQEEHDQVTVMAQEANAGEPNGFWGAGVTGTGVGLFQRGDVILVETNHCQTKGGQSWRQGTMRRRSSKNPNSRWGFFTGKEGIPARRQRENTKFKDFVPVSKWRKAKLYNRTVLPSKR